MDWRVGLPRWRARVTTLAAEQDSLHRAVLKIADIQADHTAQLTAIETTLAAILARLP